MENEGDDSTLIERSRSDNRTNTMNTDRAISMGFDDGHFNENRKTFSGTVVADDNDKFADDGDVDKLDKL